MIENFYLNENIFFWLNSFTGKNVFLDLFFIFLAKYLILILILLFIIFFLKLIYQDKKVKIRVFFIYFSGAVLAWILTKIFRFFVETERPFSYFQIETLLKEPDILGSFPSGHSTLAFALAGSVYFYHKKLGSIFLILAGLVALGRILVGVHFPLDILVGGLFGFTSSWFVYKIVVKYVS